MSLTYGGLSRCVSQKGHSRGSSIGVFHLLQEVPSTNNTSGTDSIRAEKVAPANIAILPLSNTQRDKVVHHASTKNPIARSAQTSKPKTRSHLRPHGGLGADEVRDARVVHEVQAANAGEGLHNDVRQDASPAPGVHGLKLRRDVPQLHDAVDPDENVGGLERFAVPEEHPGADADVADSVVGDELDDFVELFLLGGVGGAVFPELVEPSKLEALVVLALCVVFGIDENLQLLWEEECADEVWVWRPERDVTLMDVHHVGLGVEAVLLSSEVIGE